MAHGADTLQGSHPPTEQHRHQHARAGMPAAARGSDRHGSHPRWCARTAECITQPATACTKSQSGEGKPTLRQGSHGGKSPKQGPNKPGRSRDPNLSASKRQPINEPHTTLIAGVSQFFSYHYFPIPPHICLDAALTGSIVPCQTYDYLGSSSLSAAAVSRNAAHPPGGHGRPARRPRPALPRPHAPCWPPPTTETMLPGGHASGHRESQPGGRPRLPAHRSTPSPLPPRRWRQRPARRRASTVAA